MNKTVLAVVTYLESMSKRGVSYDERGRHGYRNPIRADTGLILQALVTARGSHRILEIGTAYGLSGCYLASVNGVTLDTIEWDEKVAEEARKNFAKAKLSVKVYNGDAMKIIKDLPHTNRYEMVFMDANKDGYLEQIKLLVELNLLDDNCLIVADNVIDRKLECQNFLDYMQQHNPVILGTECGLLVAKL